MIEQLLDQLAEIYHKLDLLNLDYTTRRQEILSPEIRSALSELDAEFLQTKDGAEVNIADLKSKIEVLAKEHGASVAGQYMRATFIKGKVTWDTKALDGYMIAEPALAAFRKEGDPFIRIEFIKKGNNPECIQPTESYSANRMTFRLFEYTKKRAILPHQFSPKCLTMAQ